MYEGEHALLWLLEALAGDATISTVPNLIYRDERGIHVNHEIHTEKMTRFRCRILTAFRWTATLCRCGFFRILRPAAATGAAAPSATMVRATSISIAACRPTRLCEQVKALKEKYQAEHFLFADESYPPALLKKVVPASRGSACRDQMDDADSVRGNACKIPTFWQDRRQSGCCTLYYGMESANERVLNLMDKHVKKSVIENNLKLASEAGIWNHVMAFYGFPGETREEARRDAAIPAR